MDIDTIAPTYVRTQIIMLALAHPLAPPQAFRAVDITVTPTGLALTSGLVLPMQLRVTSPSSKLTGTFSYVHTYRHTVPTTVVFVPKEGGMHAIVLMELHHNRFFGALQLSVAGDPLFVPS